MSNASDNMVDRLRHIPTATICDAYARLKIRPLERLVLRRIRPIGPLGTRVVGRARTQQLVPLRDAQRGSLVADRSLHFELVDKARRADFLVVAAAGRDHLASFGDVLALKAHAMGVAGVVVDGATRDAAFIVELGLPFWCDGITPIPQGYGGYSVEAVNVPVTCAGVEVIPDDIVVADGDGVVIVPPNELADILPLCEELEAQERVAREGIRQGKPLEGLYPSRAYYADNSDTGATR